MVVYAWLEKNFQIDTSAVSTSTLTFQAVFLSSRLETFKKTPSVLGSFVNKNEGNSGVSALRICRAETPKR